MKKINSWYLTTIKCKRYTCFSMVSTSIEDRCEKLEHCGVPKIIELAFEIGLPVNETIVTRNGKKQL